MLRAYVYIGMLGYVYYHGLRPCTGRVQMLCGWYISVKLAHAGPILPATVNQLSSILIFDDDPVWMVSLWSAL